MKTKIRNRYIIFSLIGILCLMGAGFAGFSQRLSVNESATNTNNWNISITNVKTKGGTATNNSNPTFTDLTATFDASFDTFGEYIEYEIEVTNKGNVNAVLESISLSDSNSVVIMTYNGINEGESLEAGAKKTFTVKLLYNRGIASGTLSLTLDYIQGAAGGAGIAGSSGVVYRWTEDELDIGDSIEGIETTTNPSTLGKNYYLKHDVENNIITGTYLCFVVGNEFCFQNGSEKFQSHFTTIFDKEDYLRQNGLSCSYDDEFIDEPIYCHGLNFWYIYIWPEGNIMIAEDPYTSCDITSNGNSYCMK